MNETRYGGALPSWMEESGPEGDIIVSSRIRLARNLKELPFPNRANKEQLHEVGCNSTGIIDAISGSEPGHPYELIQLETLDRQELKILVEKHLTSVNHIQVPMERSLIIRDDEAVCVMVNEEDHFRIQSLTAGLDLKLAWDRADKVDNIIEEHFGFAFNEEQGYLTSCPTNLGTGLRASVMMHLPGLVLLQQMHRIVGTSTRMGMAVRGLYGEGSEAFGNVFQISNQQTLGHNEKEIVSNVYGVVRQIIDQERAARRLLMQDSGDEVADRVWRAYGILRHARSIAGQEALAMLSAVRLGIDLGIIANLSPVIFPKLLLRTRSSIIMKSAGVERMDKKERDWRRAEIIRKSIEGEDQSV